MYMKHYKKIVENPYTNKPEQKQLMLGGEAEDKLMKH